MELLIETDLSNLFYRGKVRDIYRLGDKGDKKNVR